MNTPCVELDALQVVFGPAQRMARVETEHGSGTRLGMWVGLEKKRWREVGEGCEEVVEGDE